LRLPRWCHSPHSLRSRCPPGSIVYDHFGNEYVIVRYMRGDTYIVIPKYTMQQEPAGVRHRLIKAYSAREVRRASRLLGRLVQEPHYGVEVPLLGINDVAYCCPSFGTHVAELLYNTLPTLAEQLAAKGLSKCIGLTGSLIAGHWSEQYSDIDLLIEANEHCVTLLNLLAEEYKSIGGDTKRAWLIREAESRKLPLRVIEDLVTRWQRIVIDGRAVSVAVVSMQRLEPEKRFFLEKPAWGTIALSVEQPMIRELGDYPAVLASGNACIVVYDGFYIPALAMGGYFSAYGPLVDVVEPGKAVLKSCVAVGGAEGGFLRRLHLGS